VLIGKPACSYMKLATNRLLFSICPKLPRSYRWYRRNMRLAALLPGACDGRIPGLRRASGVR